MTLQKASLALTSGIQRPLQVPSVDDARARSGRSVAVVIAVLAILVMVAL